MDTAPAAPRIDFALACVHCEASLSGAPLDGNCPACSKPVGDTLDPNAIDSDTMTVSADILCPECDYNLRTLRIDGVCPECGQPFVRALSRRPLSSTDPAWRKRVLRGINRLLFVMIAVPVALITVASAATVGPNIPEPFDIVALVAMETILFVALAAGTFYVSSPGRKGADPHASAWPRRIARTAILLAGISFVWVHVATFARMTFLPPALQHASESIAVFLLVATGLILPIALGLCLRQIARLAEHESLIKSTRIWLLLFGICAPTTALSSIIAVLVSRLPSEFGEVVGVGVVLLLVLAFVDFVLYLLAISGLAGFNGLLHRADAPANGGRPSE